MGMVPLKINQRVGICTLFKWLDCHRKLAVWILNSGTWVFFQACFHFLRILIPYSYICNILNLDSPCVYEASRCSLCCKVEMFADVCVLNLFTVPITLLYHLILSESWSIAIMSMTLWIISGMFRGPAKASSNSARHLEKTSSIVI